jgi:hypothetical protein
MSVITLQDGTITVIDAANGIDQPFNPATGTPWPDQATATAWYNSVLALQTTKATVRATYASALAGVVTAQAAIDGTDGSLVQYDISSGMSRRQRDIANAIMAATPGIAIPAAHTAAEAVATALRATRVTQVAALATANTTLANTPHPG